MKKEIEAVFINIDKNKLRTKLKELGAKLIVPERKMIRTVFKTDNPATKQRSFLRVRDEGDKTVVTYKKFLDSTVTGVREINVVVDSYDNAVELFRVLELHEKSYEESLRETWEYNGAEIDIDTWPWLPTYVEIEGSSVENMTTTAQKLGFKIEDAIFDSVGKIYELYYDVSETDINTGKNGWSRIEFVPTPEWLESRRRPEPPAPHPASQ
ncbi:CYTH domain-containing protein [Candidatus Saccharibacteria bacterium]|nr:CYTH domain-containing protein [Candidatus Saccharibacteria bacterium]